MSGSSNPKLEAERLSSISIELIDLARGLRLLVPRVPDNAVASEMESQVNRLLDIASRVSATARSLVG